MNRNVLLVIVITIFISALIIGMVMAGKYANTKWFQVILPIGTFLVLNTIGITIYRVIQKRQGKSINTFMVGFIALLSLLGALLASGIYRAITFKPSVKPDQYSVGRMTQLNQVLTSYFGPKWPMIFSIFGIFLVIILGLLYNNTKTVDISLNDANYVKFQRSMIITGVIFTIGVGILAALAIKKLRQEQKSEDVLEGDFEKDSRLGQLAEVIGLGLLTLIVVGIVIWLAMKRLRKQK